jgi:lambda repressor-like predicted transcriptional regulator
VLRDKVLRDQALRQAHQDHGYSMAAIAAQAGVHYSTVSKVIQGARRSCYVKT